VPATAAALAPTSAEARERHLADWGSSTGKLLAFNGSNGIDRVLGDDIEIPAGSKFIAGLDQTRYYPVLPRCAARRGDGSPGRGRRCPYT
jgi:hypothetical protein